MVHSRTCPGSLGGLPDSLYLEFPLCIVTFFTLDSRFLLLFINLLSLEDGLALQ